LVLAEPTGLLNGSPTAYFFKPTTKVSLLPYRP